MVGTLLVRKVDENNGAYMVNIGEANQSVKNHPFAKHWTYFLVKLRVNYHVPYYYIYVIATCDLNLRSY